MLKDVGRAGWTDIALIGAFTALAILLGGATREGFVLHALIQIFAFALIAIAIAWPTDPASRAARLWMMLALALIALHAIELMPLPFGIWSHLPGRAAIADGYHLAGLGDVSAPISLAPDGTLQSLLAIVPALAIFLYLSYRHRAGAVGAVAALLAAAALSALLGLAQIVAGVNSRLYFYTNSNRGDATGFFANSNHLSTLLVTSIPLAIGVMGWLRSRGILFRKSPLPFILLGGLVPLAVLGTIASGSLAGVGLLLFVVVASLPLILVNLSRRWRWPLVAGIALLVLGAIAVGLLSPALNDFAHTDLSAGETGRPYMWHTALTAFLAFFPVGSGFGSFEGAFHLFENPLMVTELFANHAHNDLLEFALEGGLVGLLLLLLFLAWLGRRIWTVWFGPQARRSALAQAASIALVAILLHCLVDYPVRTPAITVVFALCCALIARKEEVAAPAVAKVSKGAGRHLAA